MMTGLILADDDIRKLLEEYIASGFNVKDFCSVTDTDEVYLQACLDKYLPEQAAADDPFITVNLKEGASLTRDTPVKAAASKKLAAPSLFARIGDIELFQQVSAAYLKSLKS